MKSSIKIDYLDRGTGKGMEPVIKVQIFKTDDPRDTLLSYLFESIGSEEKFLELRHVSGGIEMGVPDSSYDNILLFKPE